MEERFLGKEEVIGSIPIFGSAGQPVAVLDLAHNQGAVRVRLPPPLRREAEGISAPADRNPWGPDKANPEVPGGW